MFTKANRMNLFKASVLALFMITSMNCGGDDPITDGNEGADLVLRNGRIYTVNSASPWAESIAIEDGVITYIGDDSGIDAYLGTSSEVINLNGRMVMPGIHDVHIHPLEAGSQAISFELNSQETDPERFARTIENAAFDNPGSGWLIGWGHSIFTLLDATRPVKEIIDEVVSDRPIIILEETSHSAFVNSKALEMAGFTANTPNPVGGIIMKDSRTGEPNGILIDNAGNVVMDLALAPNATTAQQDRDGLVNFMLPELARHGITSISDARTYYKRNHHQVWQDIEASGELTARVNLGLWAYPDDDDATQLSAIRSLYSNDPSKLLKINQVKIYSDGIVINTTAAMKDDYLIDLFGEATNNGLNYFTQDRIAQYITELEPMGFDFHIHTIGNRGITEALNAIESSTSGSGRHRLTHIEIMDPADYSRFAALNVTADAQVAGDFSNPAHWMENVDFIGAANSQNVIPLKSLSEANARITLSSDHDVSTLNPFVAMQNAVTRTPQELTMEEVIKAYTINAAYVMRQEDRVGTLERGKLADVIVLNQNLFDVANSSIGSTTVDFTVLNGKVIYRK